MENTDNLSEMDFAQYVFDLEIDNLKGRYWQAPALEKKADSHVIVFLYGHHSSLERNLGLVQYLRRFGRVIMPDLPGLGGMDSFYKIGKKPTLDNYAQYLEAFLNSKLAQNQKFTLFGMSLGLVIVTRFLQKYPQRRKDLRLLISVAGFLTGSTLKFSKVRRFIYLKFLMTVKIKLGAWLFRCLVLNRWILRTFYARTFSAKAKFKNQTSKRKKQLLDMEVHLWHCNDVRTWAFTAYAMISCDLTNQKIKYDLYQIDVSGDQFLDGDMNKINLRKVYNKVVFLKLYMPAHAPTVIARVAEIEEIMPQEMIGVLKKEFSKNLS